MKSSKTFVTLVLVLLSGPRPAIAQSLSDTLGPHLLAAVENAREALSLGDRVATGNDLDEAVSDARQLLDLSSPLFPVSAAPEPGVSGMTAMSPFKVQSRLLSAQAEVGAGDFSTADSTLASIQASVPRRLVPANFEILRARLSLDSARDAIGESRPENLKTQLVTASDALKRYAGSKHSSVVKALARDIDRVLSEKDGIARMDLEQPQTWIQLIDAWR